MTKEIKQEAFKDYSPFEGWYQYCDNMGNEFRIEITNSRAKGKNVYHVYESNRNAFSKTATVLTKAKDIAGIHDSFLKMDC